MRVICPCLLSPLKPTRPRALHEARTSLTVTVIVSGHDSTWGLDK